MGVSYRRGIIDDELIEQGGSKCSCAGDDAHVWLIRDCLAEWHVGRLTEFVRSCVRWLWVVCEVKSEMGGQTRWAGG
jgi:hypothetical protein